MFAGTARAQGSAACDEPIRRSRGRIGRQVLFAGLALALGAGLTPAAIAGAATGSDADPAGHPTELFPPRANAVWAYDDTDVSGEWVPGRWAGLINGYNGSALPENRISEIFSYGTDMEMYCPENDAQNCTIDDLYSFYTADSNGYASTGAYAQNLQPIETDDPDTELEPVLLSPIIDGRTDPGGYLIPLNELGEDLARGYADKVAQMVCADGRIDGIQFDVEPFDVTSKNGQYYFYLQLAQNFAGAHDPASVDDPYGCVDADHAQGRFFSFFTFPDAIEPGTESAANVADMVTSYGNGYIMGSLYDLSAAPAGTLTDLATYTDRVRESVATMKDWAGQLSIPYGFGIPASASAHEYTTCTGPDCVPTADGVTGYPMMSYTSAAVEAMHASNVVADPLYRGTAIWDLGASVEWNGNVFAPAPAPTDVLEYLGQHLNTPPGDDACDGNRGHHGHGQRPGNGHGNGHGPGNGHGNGHGPGNGPGDRGIHGDGDRGLHCGADRHGR